MRNKQGSTTKTANKEQEATPQRTHTRTLCAVLVVASAHKSNKQGAHEQMSNFNITQEQANKEQETTHPGELVIMY